MIQIKGNLIIILAVAILVCRAEPAKYQHRSTAVRQSQPLRHNKRPADLQKRVLARQEVVTPYPTADELKPNIPFNEGIIPDEVYGPPNEIYGPPDADQLPSEDAPKEFASKPNAEEFHPNEEQASRLTTKGKLNRVSLRLVQKKKAPKSQRLLMAPTGVIITQSSPYMAQPLNQPFAYASHYHDW